MTFAYTDVPQIEDLPESWTSEEIDLYLELESESQWDDDWDTTAPLIPFFP